MTEYQFIVGPEPNDMELTLCSAVPSVECDGMRTVNLDPKDKIIYGMMVNLYLNLAKEMNIVRVIELRSCKVAFVHDEKYGECVLKIIRNSCFRNTSAVRPPIPREVRIMNILAKHNVLNVARYYKWYYHGIFSTVLMPYYPFDDVDTVWHSMYCIGVYMRQLLKVLHEMLMLDVMHRDIKPANISWNNKERRLTLLDFGLSTLRAREMHYRPIGTTTFMSPEVYRLYSKEYYEQIGYNYKSDVYSVGVLLGSFLYKCYEYEVTRDLVEYWREASSKFISQKKVDRTSLEFNYHSMFVHMIKRNPDKRPDYEFLYTKISKLLDSAKEDYIIPL